MSDRLGSQHGGTGDLGCASQTHEEACRLATHAAVALSSCNGSSPTPTRLVGAHRVALLVPADWKTHVEHGDTCPPTDPKTVQFFAPLHGPVGSCAVPTGASWPAQQSVSIYTGLSGPAPHRTPSGTVHGLPYYIAEVRQPGPGVGMGLRRPPSGCVIPRGCARPRNRPRAAEHGPARACRDTPAVDVLYAAVRARSWQPMSGGLGTVLSEESMHIAPPPAGHLAWA
jgi:hypothetical protein